MHLRGTINTSNSTNDYRFRGNIFDEVINEQPDQQSCFNDLTSSKMTLQRTNMHLGFTNKPYMDQLKEQDFDQPNYFSLLTTSQKQIQIQKIYRQSKINQFMLQIRQIIGKAKLQITQFCEKNPKRQSSLKVYLRQLDQLDFMLNSTLGQSQVIKAFTAKRTVQILKKIGKIESQSHYQKLINQINQIAGIEEQILPQKHNQKSNQKLFQQNKIKIIKQRQLKVRRSITEFPRNMQIKNPHENQQNSQSKISIQAVEQTNIDKLQFQKILKRVDQIHANHLKTWERHNQEMKEFQEKKRQIIMRRSTFHNKIIANRRILIRHSSLREMPLKVQQNTKGSSNNETQIQSKFKISQTSEKNPISSSLPSLNKQTSRKLSRNENKIKFKLLQEERNIRNIKNKSTLKLRQSSFRLSKGQSEQISKSKIIEQKKKSKSPSKSNKSDKQNIKNSRSKSKSKFAKTRKSNRSSSLKSFSDKNNSVKKSPTKIHKTSIRSKFNLSPKKIKERLQLNSVKQNRPKLKLTR